MPSFDRQNLLHNFIRRKIAFPTFQAARAKFAAVGAADLRRNTQRVPVAGFAVKRGIGGNQNTFDERMIGQSPEKFLRGVLRALLAGEFESLKRKFSAQHFAQCLRQIGHRVPTRHALAHKASPAIARTR